MRFKKFYKIIITVSIIEIFFILNLSAQTYISHGDFYSTNNNYAESPLQKGLPEIQPGKSYPLKLNDVFFAWINPASGFEAIYFIKGIDSNKKQKYEVLTVLNDQEYETVPFKLVKETKNNIYGYVIINATTEYAYSFPLRINFSKRDNSIKYFWPQNIGTNNSGGIGTVIPVIKAGQKIGSNFISSLDKNMNSKKLKDKIIVLNWGNPSSEACQKSEAAFDSLYKNFGKNKNVVFILAGGSTNNSNGNYFRIRGNTTVSSALGETFPLNLIIDSSGKVLYSQVGYNQAITNRINTVLKKYIPSH